MREISNTIVEHLATLSTSPGGWVKELNRVSWNRQPPVYDLRKWSPDHDKCNKGITLNDGEMNILLAAVMERQRSGESET